MKDYFLNALAERYKEEQCTTVSDWVSVHVFYTTHKLDFEINHVVQEVWDTVDFFWWELFSIEQEYVGE